MHVHSYIFVCIQAVYSRDIPFLCIAADRQLQSYIHVYVCLYCVYLYINEFSRNVLVNVYVYVNMCIYTRYSGVRVCIHIDAVYHRIISSI